MGGLRGRGDRRQVWTRGQHLRRPEGEGGVLGLRGEVQSWEVSEAPSEVWRIVGALCAGTHGPSPQDSAGVQGSGFPGFALGVARQSRAASGCPPPSSWPRWSAGPGRALRPARDRLFPGRAWPGLGSPGDGSGHLGSVGRSERGLCVKAGRTGGRRARSLAVGHGELRKGWGSQDGWKEEVQRAPPRASPRPRLPLARPRQRGLRSSGG